MHSKKTPEQALFSEETKQFWAICTELSEARRLPASRQADEAIVALLEELEAMQLNTAQPILRQRCAAMLAVYTGGANVQAGPWLSRLN